MVIYGRPYKCTFRVDVVIVVVVDVAAVVGVDDDDERNDGSYDGSFLFFSRKHRTFDELLTFEFKSHDVTKETIVDPVQTTCKSIYPK